MFDKRIVLRLFYLILEPDWDSPQLSKKQLAWDVEYHGNWQFGQHYANAKMPNISDIEEVEDVVRIFCEKYHPWPRYYCREFSFQITTLDNEWDSITTQYCDEKFSVLRLQLTSPHLARAVKCWHELLCQAPSN